MVSEILLIVTSVDRIFRHMPTFLDSVLSRHAYMFLYKMYFMTYFFTGPTKVTCTGDDTHFVRHCVDLLYENCYNVCRTCSLFIL